MHISEAQQIVDQWIKTYGVRYFDNLTNMAILTEEVGEVARLMARIHGEQSFKKTTTIEEQNSALSDEIADVLWVLICIANQNSINLEKALLNNIQKKTNRDKSRHINNNKL